MIEIDNGYAYCKLNSYNGNSMYIATKLDGNQIFDIGWFENNIGKKIIRIDIPKGDTKTNYKRPIKITVEQTWQEVSVLEELFQSQFGWDYRYKLYN